MIKKDKPLKTNGPGKYDDACTVARESVQADGAVLIIYNGNKGSGFSVQGPENMVRSLPDVLDFMSKQIRESLGVQLQ